VNDHAASTPLQTSNLEPHALTIGIRDSGVGGLTVAREIKKRLPHAQLLYFADTAHVPYGDRTPAEVRHFALSISEFLIKEGAQLVVFACNTSSAYALQNAKKRFATPLVGMIEPGARAALAVNRNHAPVGVLATNATVQSRMYARWIEGLDAQTSCIEIGCPDFVPLVEDELTSTPAARVACEKYLRPLLERGVETVVLGCTHFPLLLPMLSEVANEYSSVVRFVDPAQAVAAEVAKLLPETESTPSADADRFFVSGATDGVRGWVEKLLDNTLPRIEAGPVFSLPSSIAENDHHPQGITHVTYR
jgi:glutamate racemase